MTLDVSHFISDKTFVDEHVDLTGCHVLNCVFTKCTVELWNRKGEASRMFAEIRSCTFDECTHVGDGWPTPVIVVPLQ